MKVSFSITDTRLLIKAVDDLFNVYTCCINTSDPFVVNYCNKNLQKLHKLLENYELEENDEFYLFKVIEPVNLTYKLKLEKVSNDTISNLVIGQLNELKMEIENVKKRTSELEEQLENGVILPGYGVIEKNCKSLILFKDRHNFNGYLNGSIGKIGYDNSNSYLDYGVWQYNIGGLIINICENNEFYGTSIKPLRYLENLEELFFLNNFMVNDFTDLRNCKKLNKCCFLKCNIKDINFMSELKELQEIVFIECKKLENITSLTKLPKLQRIVVKNCIKIVNMPEFNSRIKIEK